MRKIFALLALLAFLALLAPAHARAQGVAGAAVLQIPLDVRSEGMGRAYEVLTLGPQAARANPGALGLLPGVQAYGMKAQLVPDLADDVRFKHGAVVVGVRPSAGLPVRLSLGFNYTRLDYGETVITQPGSPDPPGTVEPFEDVMGGTVAIGLGDYVGIGLGVKQVGINLPDISKPLTLNSTDVSAVDYGVFARSPRMALDIFNTPEPIGTVRILGAMAWGNRGEPFTLEGNEARSPDPLPEVWRQSIGLELDFLPASRAFQTRHRWVERWLENAHFLSFSGAVGREQGIDEGKPESGPTFSNHRGYELRVLDLLSVRRGHIYDPAGGIVDNTFGWGISFLGYAGFDYARIPQFQELQTVDKWAFWVRLPIDALGG